MLKYGGDVTIKSTVFVGNIVHALGVFEIYSIIHAFLCLYPHSLPHHKPETKTPHPKTEYDHPQ